MFCQIRVYSVIKNFFKQLWQYWKNRDWSIFRWRPWAMNFRNWSDGGNFPGIWEFTSGHAFVEEFGQPFWHNAISYLILMHCTTAFYLNKDWRCVEHETSFLVQINYCDWFAWSVVTAVALLLLLNDKSKLDALQRDGRPRWRFPQTAGCKARTCFVDSDKWRQIPSIGVFHQCWHQLKNFEKRRKGLRAKAQPGGVLKGLKHPP